MDYKKLYKTIKKECYDISEDKKFRFYRVQFFITYSNVCINAFFDRRKVTFFLNLMEREETFLIGISKRNKIDLGEETNKDKLLSAFFKALKSASREVINLLVNNICDRSEKWIRTRGL